MNKAFKCAKCSNIQLKGTRCVDDGTELVECDLDAENTIDQPFDSPMVEHEENEFIRNIRIASDLKNPKNIQQPERNYVKNFIKLELPKKPKILDYLNICFLNQDHSRRDDIYHKIDNWTRGSNVLFVTISVYIPLEYAESNQLYYYYFLQENEKNSIKIAEENNLLVNKKLRSYDSKRHLSIDGLIWFQNKDEKEVKKMKRESIIYKIKENFYLLKNDSLAQHSYFLSLIKTIQESLCTESDYDQFFHEAIENELNDLLIYMKKKPRLPENVKSIWAITILFISHKYDLKNFPNEYQFKFLLKQLLSTMVEFFEFIFLYYFFEEKKIICDIFEEYLHKNFQYSYQDVLTLLLFYYNLLENINQKENASIRNYRNFPLKLDHSDNIQKILCFGSISQNINERTFFELIKNLWPILVLKNEHSLIFIHYLCDSNLSNLKTLLDCNQLTSNMLLNYLYYLIELTTDTEKKQLSPKSKEFFNEILCYLIKKALDDFNKFINYKNGDRRKSLWLKNFNPEVCLLEHLIDKGYFDFELVSKLTHLCLIINQMKFIIADECELPPNDEYNHILKQIKILLMNHLENCRFDENYALVSNEVINKSEAFIFDKMLSISCYSNKPKLINNDYISFIVGILNDHLKNSSFEHVAEIYFCFDFKTLINKEVIRKYFEQKHVQIQNNYLLNLILKLND